MQVLLRHKTCGPGGVAVDVSLTSQQVCKGCTRRPFLRRTKRGVQDRLPRVVGSKGGLVIKKKSSRSCVRKWSCSVSSKVGGKARKREECQREEDVVLKRIAMQDGG